MLGFMVRSRIRSNEKQLGVSLDYMREMYAKAPDVFWRFVKVAKAANFRGKLPATPLHVACLVAIKHQDCGECVQISVNVAKKDGVPVDVLKATLAGKVDELPESLRDVYRFAEAVARNTGEEETYRPRLVKVFGEEAVIEMAVALALCQTFPIVKRGMGHARSCSMVKVEV